MAERLELVGLFRGSMGKVLDFLLASDEEITKSDIARKSGVTFKTVSDMWPTLEKYCIVKYVKTIGMAKLYSLDRGCKLVDELQRVKRELKNGNHRRGLGEIFSIYGLLLIMALPLLGTLYLESNTTDMTNDSILNVTTIVAEEPVLNVTTIVSNETAEVTETLQNTTMNESQAPEQNISIDNATQEYVVNATSNETILNITAPEPITENQEPAVIETTVEELAYWHGPVTIGDRVQWYRQIVTYGGENYTIGLNLPPDYQDLNIADASGNYSFENGTLFLSGDHNIQMSFTTSPVEVSEESLSDKPYEKKVTVVSHSTLHYSNVAVSTSIPEKTDITIIELPGKDVTNDPVYNVTFSDSNGKTATLSWIVPQLSTKEYLIQETTKKQTGINFDRFIDCHKCGQHKAPPLAVVNMTISASFVGTLNAVDLVDYFPTEWTPFDLNGGVSEGYNSTHNKITWHYDSINGSVFQWYMIRSPDLTSPPTEYYFISGLAGQQSDPWRVMVSDKTVYYLAQVKTGNVSNIFRGDTKSDIFCNVTVFPSGTGAATTFDGYVSLQYYNTTAWVDLNTTTTYLPKNLTYDNTYGTNPRYFTGIAGNTTYRFAFLGNITGLNYQLRCNATDTTNSRYNISSIAYVNVTNTGLKLNLTNTSTAHVFADNANDFNITCNVSTVGGTSDAVSVYFQWNTSASTTWNNFTTTNTLALYANDTSPDLWSTAINNVSWNMTTYAIYAHTAGSYWFRCYSNSSSYSGGTTNTSSAFPLTVYDRILFGNFSTNISSATNYSSTQGYQFNATAFNSSQVSKVWLRANFTGAFANYSATNYGGNSWYYNAGVLGAGSYTYTWWANDTALNYFNTTDQTYVVNHNSSVITLSLNGTAGDRSYFNNTVVNLGNSTTPGYINASLSFYYNTSTSTTWTSISSPQAWAISSFPADTYWISMNFTGDNNYTSSSSIRMLTMNDSRILFGNFSTNVSSPLNYSSTQGYQFNATAFNSSTVSKVWIRADFTGAFANYSATNYGGNSWYYNAGVLGAGSYTYTWWANDSLVTYFNTTDQTFTVDKHWIPITLYINGTNGDVTANNATTANFTANFSSSYSYAITLYTNLTGTMTLWDTQNSPLRNYTVLNPYQARSGYAIIANFSNDNYSLSSATHALSLNESNIPNLNNFLFNVSNNTNYSSTQGYQFNATVIEPNLDTVWVEHNFTGVLTNYTVNTNVSYEYYYEYVPLAAGYYTIKWYANDTYGNLNKTDWVHYYQVNKSLSNITLSLNGTVGDRSYFNNTVVNLGNATTPGYINSSLSFYYNTSTSTAWTSISSPQAWAISSMPADTYWVSMNFTGDQNYSSSSSIRMLTMNDSRILFGNFSTNVSSPLNYSSTQGYQFNATAFNSSQVSKVWLRADFTGAFANYSATNYGGNSWYYNAGVLGAGSYTYVWWANDTLVNYFNSTDQTYQVNKGYLSMTLYINGTDGDSILYNNSDANFTANFSSGNAFTIEIWSNLTGSWAQDGSGASPYELIKTLNPYQARDYLIKANWSGDQNYSYSEASHMLTLNVTSGAVVMTPLSPVNGTIVDRDSVDASTQDYIELIAATSAATTVNVTFKANLTDPSIGGQTNIVLGYNTTNSSGTAVLYWDSDVSYYAGNYTWWAEANTSYTVNGTMTALVYGGFNLAFQSASAYPASSYTLGEMVKINATVLSLGPESVLQLNSSYKTQVNSTIIAEDSTTRDVSLTYWEGLDGNWTGNYTLVGTDPLSGNPYNVSLNATANYFFINMTNFSRSFEVVTNVTVSITLLDAPIDYESKDPGINTSAKAGAGFPMIIRVDSITNVNVDIFIKSNDTNMTGPDSNYILVQNQTFSNLSDGTGNKSLTTSFQLLQNNILVNQTGLGQNISCYWWLSVPQYMVPGLYSNTIIVNVNQSA